MEEHQVNDREGANDPDEPGAQHVSDVVAGHPLPRLRRRYDDRRLLPYMRDKIFSPSGRSFGAHGITTRRKPAFGSAAPSHEETLGP